LTWREGVAAPGALRADLAFGFKSTSDTPINRRQLLAGGVAVASFLSAAEALRAQEAATDEAKMAPLEGGLSLMQTSQIT
jgi:hypothetical protein